MKGWLYCPIDGCNAMADTQLVHPRCDVCNRHMGPEDVSMVPLVVSHDVKTHIHRYVHKGECERIAMAEHLRRLILWSS